MTDVLIATTVAGTGEAEADYNLATFNLSVVREAATQADVQVALVQATEDFQAKLDELESLGVKVVKGSLTAYPNIQPNIVWEDQVRVTKGYTGTYNVSFDVSSLDKISLAYANLSVLEGVQNATPNFSLKNTEKLNVKALAKAWEKVFKRFADECKVLGLSPDDYRVASWEVSYSDSHRTGRSARAARSSRGNTLALASAGPSAMMMSAVGGDLEGDPTVGATMDLGGSAPSAPALLEIVVGKASVTVNLNVSYVKK